MTNYSRRPSSSSPGGHLRWLSGARTQISLAHKSTRRVNFLSRREYVEFLLRVLIRSSVDDDRLICSYGKASISITRCGPT